jgi:hypothetical protein
MGNQAKVIDPGIFDELKAALTKFESEAGDSVRSAERAIQETRNWLEERFGYWSSEVNRRKRELEHAQDALKRCQSSAQSSNDKDKREQKKNCSAEAQAIMQAKRALEQAEANLRVAKKWKDDFANLESNLRSKAQGFRQSLNEQISSASNSIVSTRNDLQRYLQQSAGSSVSGTSLSNQQAATEKKIHYHHIYPQKFRSFFEKMGIDIEQYKVAVSDEVHLKYIHSREVEWNQNWDAWIKEHDGEVDQDEVLRFGRKMLTRFGLEGLWEGGANPEPEGYIVPESEIYKRPSPTFR